MVCLINSTAASHSDWAAPPLAAASRCVRPWLLATSGCPEHRAAIRNRPASTRAAAQPPAAPGKATPRPASAGGCHHRPTIPRPSLRNRKHRINERDEERRKGRFLGPNTAAASCSSTATRPSALRQAGAYEEEQRLTPHRSPFLVTALRGRAWRQSGCCWAPAVLPTTRLLLHSQPLCDN